MDAEMVLMAVVLTGVAIGFLGIAIWMNGQSNNLARAAAIIKSRGVVVRDLGEPSPEPEE